jgi:hypothetical protein
MTMDKRYTKNDPEAPYTIAQVIFGDLFAVLHNDGWMVGRCKTSELVPKRDNNWPAIPSANAVGPMRADGTTAGAVPDSPWTLTGEAGRTFLYTEKKDTLIQAFAGINWPLMRVYVQVPKQTAQGALPRGELDVPVLGPTAVSSWGWRWTGHQSMQHRITRASMFFVPYKTEVGIALYNEASQARVANQTIMDWLINTINFEALDPRDREDAKLIEMVLKNRGDFVKWSPGSRGMGIDNFKSIYGVEPVIQTKNKLYIGQINAANEMGVA